MGMVQELHCSWYSMVAVVCLLCLVCTLLDIHVVGQQESCFGAHTRETSFFLSLTSKAEETDGRVNFLDVCQNHLHCLTAHISLLPLPTVAFY